MTVERKYVIGIAMHVEKLAEKSSEKQMRSKTKTGHTMDT